MSDSIPTVNKDFLHGVAWCLGEITRFASGPSCSVHTDDPCCHVDTAIGIVRHIRRTLGLDDLEEAEIVPETALVTQ